MFLQCRTYDMFQLWACYSTLLDYFPRWPTTLYPFEQQSINFKIFDWSLVTSKYFHVFQCPQNKICSGHPYDGWWIRWCRCAASTRCERRRKPTAPPPPHCSVVKWNLNSAESPTDFLFPRRNFHKTFRCLHEFHLGDEKVGNPQSHTLRKKKWKTRKSMNGRRDEIRFIPEGYDEPFDQFPGMNAVWSSLINFAYVLIKCTLLMKSNFWTSNGRFPSLLLCVFSWLRDGCSFLWNFLLTAVLLPEEKLFRSSKCVVSNEVHFRKRFAGNSREPENDFGVHCDWMFLHALRSNPRSRGPTCWTSMAVVI